MAETRRSRSAPESLLFMGIVSSRLADVRPEERERALARELRRRRVK